MSFANRADAGRQLAARLPHLRGQNVVVLGLPRGGVPVAFEVATALGAPLDVIVVRKLGVPFQPELGMGAIGEDGVRVLNDEIIEQGRISPDELAAVEATERAELERRALLYRRGLPRQPLKGRTAVVVDDGIATGSTARAACQVARAHGAARVVLAVPVAPPGWEARMADVADELVCVEAPRVFLAIGQFYAGFAQTADSEVTACLERAALRAAAADPVGVPTPSRAATDPPACDDEVEVVSGRARLAGHLTVPGGATGIAVFAHGSGSSRHSPRNRYVAAVLNEAGVGTLLLDLLTSHEAADRANVFDIGLLASRLVGATSWIRRLPAAAGLPVGYFGASTGAAAALSAAAEPDVAIAAVVSRGGRPDLASPRLGLVTAPTLLIVGGKDDVVLGLNRQAQAELRCENDLVVVPGATHLFEETGTLTAVAELASNWFAGHFGPAAHPVTRHVRA